MATHHDVYDNLAEKYRLVGDMHFMELLEMLLTPEEGKYLLALDKPKTPAEAARQAQRQRGPPDPLLGAGVQSPARVSHQGREEACPNR